MRMAGKTARFLFYVAAGLVLWWAKGGERTALQALLLGAMVGDNLSGIFIGLMELPRSIQDGALATVETLVGIGLTWGLYLGFDMNPPSGGEEIAAGAAGLIVVTTVKVVVYAVQQTVEE